MTLLLSTTTVNAQILTTGQTTGQKGAQAIMLTENRIYVDGVQLNIAYFQYVLGVSPRLDLYASVGGTRILQQDQLWLGLGENFNVFHRKNVDVSLFNVASLPVNKTAMASTVLLNSAVVVSHSINKMLSLYSGLNVLVPIGVRDRGVFTPSTTYLNVPVGANVNIGKWSLFLEGDIGHLKALGIGIARMF